MSPRLQSIFTRLEQQRQEFSAWVENAPELVQQRKPSAEQWSAAQVLFHMAMVELQVVVSLEKRVASGKTLKSISTDTRFRSFLLNLLLRLPLKFKAPAAVREVPEALKVPLVVSQWQEIRERLHTFLSTFPHHQLDKEIFRHPRSGMLTLPQTLQFLMEHHEHHRRQLKKLLS